MGAPMFEQSCRTIDRTPSEITAKVAVVSDVDNRLNGLIALGSLKLLQHTVAQYVIGVGVFT